MTPAQKATLKAAILADPFLAAQVANTDGSYIIAQELNKMAVPDYWVWKTAVSVDEIMRNGMDWARVDNLGVGKARIWEWMGRLGSFDASKTNIRAGIDATWAGVAADLAVREMVYTHCKRTARRIEKILATGVGTNLAPSVMGFEGEIGYLAVDAARA